MKRGLKSQHFLFKKVNAEHVVATRARVRVAHLIAKHGKTFTDGDLIKDCMIAAIKDMCPEKANLFKNISLSANTVARRVVDISENILTQWFYLAVLT